MIKSATLCLNGQRFFHQMRTRTLPISVDLLAWLKAQPELPKVFWNGKDGSEIASCGRELLFNEIPHFETGNDSPARLWGGHTFSPSSPPKDDTWKGFPHCGFFLPQIELIRKDKTITIIEHAIHRPLGEAREILPKFFKRERYGLKGGTHLPKEKSWDELVNSALKQIQKNLFEKIVIGRRSTHTLEGNVEPLEILSQITLPETTRFAIQFSPEKVLIGATPEHLYLRKKLEIYAEALAGTCSIDVPASTLFNSPKDLREFELTKTSIEKALSPLSSKLIWGKDQTITHARIRHLYNPLCGSLNKGVDDSQILAALHPTAAIGGFPKDKALDHLEEIEPFERGWYASPVGYISQEQAEFCVAIRSALIDGKQIHLFAGAGIVEGSLPDKEWDELEQKTALWKNR